MFAGVSCWLFYIAEGSLFVDAQHPLDFQNYLLSHPFTATSVKEFIAGNIFLRYIASGANIVLFLLATTCIVEVLSNNGCFDFMAEWLRTRRPRKLMWMLALLTFIISANLDNLITVVLLFSIIHPLLGTDKLRRIYGTVIVLSATCGGAITVIGDITSLQLWTAELVTPSPYFLTLVIPLVIALAITLALLQSYLPSRVEFTTIALPYRGDDTRLNRWQRLLMLFVGIGGLWSIPTFHRITLLPPFLGAFCVLALLWFVDELCNRQLLRSDLMVRKRLPLALQYTNLQNLLYFIGLLLMFSALCETGLLQMFFGWIMKHTENVYLISLLTTLSAALLGNIPTMLGSISIFNQPDCTSLSAAMGTDGAFWALTSYATAWGSSLLITGSVAGLLLMRMEGASFGWYAKHIMPRVLLGFFVGFLVLMAITWV